MVYATYLLFILAEFELFDLHLASATGRPLHGQVSITNLILQAELLEQN